MNLESEFENQPFAVRRVVLASRWRQGLTSLFKMTKNRCKNNQMNNIDSGAIFLSCDLQISRTV